MNGYSYYAREVVLHTIVGYYYSNPTQSPYVGFYHRLSSSVCDGDAVGWSELSAGGYSPLPEPPSFKFYAELGTNNDQYLRLGRGDIEFPVATSPWLNVSQFGRWGHETLTSREYLTYGAELGGLTIPEGSRLVFFATDGLKTTILT